MSGFSCIAAKSSSILKKVITEVNSLSLKNAYGLELLLWSVVTWQESWYKFTINYHHSRTGFNICLGLCLDCLKLCHRMKTQQHFMRTVLEKYNGCKVMQHFVRLYSGDESKFQKIRAAVDCVASRVSVYLCWIKGSSSVSVLDQGFQCICVGSRVSAFLCCNNGFSVSVLQQEFQCICVGLRVSVYLCWIKGFSVSALDQGFQHICVATSVSVYQCCNKGFSVSALDQGFQSIYFSGFQPKYHYSNCILTTSQKHCAYDNKTNQTRWSIIHIPIYD